MLKATVTATLAALLMAPAAWADRGGHPAHAKRHHGAWQVFDSRTSWRRDSRRAQRWLRYRNDREFAHLVGSALVGSAITYVLLQHDAAYGDHGRYDRGHRRASRLACYRIDYGPHGRELRVEVPRSACD